jgi:Dolichyl-phosphate-mannose-protein mannosyltransferase
MSAKAAEQNSSANLAAIAFAVFAVVLLVAFFSYRGSDVGQLGKLAGSLGGGPLFGSEGFVNSALGTVIALAILSCWYGIGRFLHQFIERSDNENRSAALDFAIACSIGAVIWSIFWFVVGIAGGYTRSVAVITTVLGLALAIAAGHVNLRSVKFSTNDKLLMIMAGAPVLLALIGALAPPTAKDTLLYHLSLPKAFIGQGGLGIIDGNMASYLSLGAEMHDVWAMLLGDLASPRAAEAAAGVTTFLFFPLLLLAVYGWAREAASRGWSIVAVVVIATVPSVYHVSSGGYIDVALALFVTLAVYSLSRWWKTGEWAPLFLIAIFLGAALSIKLTSVFIFAAFALIILLRARSEGSAVGKVILPAFTALLLAGVIASPWYIRTWNETGSPVFPFYMNIWKGEAKGWDVERSNLFQAMNNQYGGENKTAANYLLAPLNLSVKGQPEIAEYFDGVIGIAFLFGLPLLVWGLWKFDLPVDAKIGAGIVGIMFLFWLFSSQQIRYLLPVLPALAIAIVAAGETISANKDNLRRVLHCSFAAAGVAGILVTAAWFFQKAPLRVALGGEARDQYLTRNLDYYPYYVSLNRDTPADAKVWLINMRRDTYNIDRPVFSDYLFEDWTLRKMLWESRDLPELRTKTAAMGIKYILARHDFLFDYDRSSIVDDKKPRAENEAKLKLARDFILDPANTVKADNKFSLIKVL